jgi:hypothetical protein
VAVKELRIVLSDPTLALLDAVVDGENPSRWLYLVFRKVAADWVRAIDELTVRGSVPVNPTVPSLGRVELSSVKFDQYKFTEASHDAVAPAGHGAILVRFPERVFRNLERGLAVQAAYNEKVGGPAGPVWKTPGQWLTEVATEAILAAHADTERAAMEQESRELYPDNS